jgi:hypothetical protein
VERSPSVFDHLSGLDPIKRNELLCRRLNPGASEFFHDLDSKGVRFGGGARPC